MKNNNDNLLLDAIKNLGKLEAENKKLKASLAKIKKQQKSDKEILAEQVRCETHNAHTLDVLSLRFSRVVDVLAVAYPKLKNEIEKIGSSTSGD